MNLQSFFIGLLTSVLIGQLSYSHPIITIKSVNYGATADKGVISHHTPNKKYEPARFVFNKVKPNAIVLVGDVLLARNVESLMTQKGNDYPFKGFDLRGIFSSSYIIGNFESPIPRNHKPTNAGEMLFSVEPQYLPSLVDAGFTHFSVANNHTYDHGRDGLLNTVAELSKAGLEPFGNPNRFSEEFVTYLDTHEKVIALVGIHALGKIPTTRQLSKLFTAAGKKSDFQIAYVHWGTEYKTQNDKAQRDFAEALVTAGADLVVGHHPHVVQNIDLIDGVPVFYSLGNYIFDQYLSKETEQGLVVALDLTNEPVIYLMPVTSLGSPSQPQRMAISEHATFLANLAEMSEPALKMHIKQGVIPLNGLVASSPKIAMMD
jgi:hypothetical protein